MRRRIRAQAEDGFTLVELMLAVVLMAVIVAPLTAGVVVGLRTTNDARNRLASSNDAQLLSIWLPPDVQSAGNQSGDVVAAPTANSECSGVSNALRLRWRETQSTTTTYIAAYAVNQDSNTQNWQLERFYCVGGGAPVRHVVAKNLASSSAVSVTVSGTKVTLQVQTKSTPTDSTGYTIRVSGARRTP